MAEAILTPLVKMVTGKLASLAQDEVISVWGINKELEKLSDTLSTIQAVLKDAENKQEKEKSEAVRIWLRQLKEIAYDADDLLDEFAVKALRRRIQTSKRDKVHNFLTRSASNTVLFSWKMSHKVKEIWKRLDQIAKDRRDLHLITYGDVDGGRQPESNEQRETSSLVDEAHVFGRREVRRELTEFLVPHEVRARNVSVISIVGMGGLGKTTLAQLVFNDEIVKKEFDLKMWICVSQDFVVKRLTKAMINSATSSKSYNLEEQDLPLFVNELDPLQTKLKDILSGRRFLLVLDDVWNEEQGKWDSLRVPLTAAGEGSIVIVTTRSETVSQLMGTTHTYHLEGLAESDCWSLFKQRAFGDESLEAHPRLVEIGREIVKKCQGLPLAAKTLGGILALKREESEWNDILESELWDFPRINDEILPILNLSYNHLPSHLKQCFVYCSLFPKHYEFKKTELIHLWIGEGFILPEGRKELQDIGLKYFEELKLTSFFQYSQQNEGEAIYKMHSMIHDLAQSISEGVCFRIDGHQLCEISTKARHYSVTRNHDKPIDFESIYKSRRLRTFLLPNGFNRAIINPIPDDFFLRLRCLRVLDLSNTATEKLPDSVGNLKHLRYMNLSSTYIQRLPKSVGTLYSLLTLKLNGCHQLLHLPKNLKNLINLRHLAVDESYAMVTMPVQIGKLTNLQTLSKFIVGKNRGYGIEELKNMIDLRGEICILNLENVASAEKAREAGLKNKQLQKLGLEWSSSHHFLHDVERDEEGILEGLQPHTTIKQLYIENYSGASFPSWMSDSLVLSNLVSLSLQGCRKCEVLPSLGKLPCLNHLVIDSFNKLVHVSHEFCGEGSIKGFPALEVLYFTSMGNLEEWCDVREGEFPRLCKLMLLDWPMLKKPPNGLQHLTSLKHLLIMGFHNLLSLPVDGLPPALESLEITFCHSLTSLPRGLRNLSSLQRLEIRSCSKLVSLPADGLPDKLQNLWISGCPNLEEQCKKGGEDWLKIAHIPVVNM